MPEVPEVLHKLARRFDPGAFDAPAGRARLRLRVEGEGEFDAIPRDGLLEAILVGKRAGLGSHQMMARTYLHLGAVYITGFGDRDKGLRQFENAVKIRPGIQLTSALVAAHGCSSRHAVGPTGGWSSTRGRYSTSWMRLSKVRWSIISRATSG